MVYVTASVRPSTPPTPLLQLPTWMFSVMELSLDLTVETGVPLTPAHLARNSQKQCGKAFVSKILMPIACAPGTSW